MDFNLLHSDQHLLLLLSCPLVHDTQTEERKSNTKHNASLYCATTDGTYACDIDCAKRLSGLRPRVVAESVREACYAGHVGFYTGNTFCFGRLCLCREFHVG